MNGALAERRAFAGPLVFDCGGSLFADVPTSITHFVAFEIFGWGGVLRCGFLAALWHRALVPVLGAVVVVYVAVKVGIAVKP
jgi:hypothetical protein